MLNNKVNHFPYISGQVISNINKTTINSYLIALEAWRRGLTIKWYAYPPSGFDNYKRDRKYFVGFLYSISNGANKHNFYLSWGDKNTYESYENTQNKAVAKEILANAGITVPEGKNFDDNAPDREIMAYAEQSGYPLVIKPVDQGKGRGVVLNIKSAAVLQEALKEVRHEQGYRNIIVEKYVAGEEYRVYVIGNSVVSAVYRKPPNIIGDGVRTINQLIAEKNIIRLENPHIKTLLNPMIKVDQQALDYLDRYGYTLKSIPGKDELVYLREKGNFSEGSDSVDVTDLLPQEVKDFAVRAVKATPGLTHAGIDLVVDSESKPNHYRSAVLEFNASALLGSHIYPLEGKPRDIPAELIDFYFPETKGYYRNKKTIYFGFNSVLKPLESGSASSVELIKAPAGELIVKVYHTTRKSLYMIRPTWVRKKALENSLHGYIKYFVNGTIKIMVASDVVQNIEEFENTCLAEYDRLGVIEYDDSDETEIIKVGFHIIDDLSRFKKLRGVRISSTLYVRLKQSKPWQYLGLQANKMKQSILSLGKNPAC